MWTISHRTLMAVSFLQEVNRQTLCDCRFSGASYLYWCQTPAFDEHITHKLHTLHNFIYCIKIVHNKCSSFVISLFISRWGSLSNEWPLRWRHKAAGLSNVGNRTRKWAWQNQYSSFWEKSILWKTVAVIDRSVWTLCLQTANS